MAFPAIIPFSEKLLQSGLYPLSATAVEILQLNITRRCNLACRHCHVEAGPDRTESMSHDIIEKCLTIAAAPSITTIDITGGAPEMHPELPWLLNECSKLNKRLLVRSNLVILLDKQYTACIDHYARLGVEVVGSLPDSRRERSDRQRGEGFFERTIEAIRQLNTHGFGMPGSGLKLNLVHNPAGAYLPACQQTLEDEFKVQLLREYNIRFNQLFSLTNCPIGRFRTFLDKSGNLTDYLRDLVRAYNPGAAQRVMCRTMISVGWDGTLYDCDFNQMLGCAINHGAPAHIDRFDFDLLARRSITVDDHCYCCTAGAGSSCQGSLEHA
jgi:radical SAM/Cys-rich protein